MRQQVRIQVSAEQCRLLQNMFSNRHGQPGWEPVTALLDQLRLSFNDTEDDAQELIKRAIKMYAKNSSDDIEIDSDAPLSHADEGTWVGAWVWVPATAPEQEQD